MIRLKPQEILSEQEVEKGLRMVIWDGLAAEVMTSFTGGAFLVAMALLLGANNKEIGLLAALPMLTNFSQLVSIWLVQRYHNRRAVAVYGAFLARLPLVLLGASIWMFAKIPIGLLLFFLFFYYFFGSMAGPSWNSWMKDMVPEKLLGEYFSRRSRYTQTLNVLLSMLLALLVDLIKHRYPSYELLVYASFFMIAGIIGIIGGYFLSRAPEPLSHLKKTSIISLFKLPLLDLNFRRLLIFNSAWVFALNLATPFFTVFMLKSLGLPVSYVIMLSIISQLFSILTLRMWGIFSDRYSNKSIISLSGPLYILCLIAWCFVGIYSQLYANLLLLIAIHALTGIANGGINLSLTNIGLKLAPKGDAIVYLSVKNMVTSLCAAIGPLIGGTLADYFTSIHLLINVELDTPQFHKIGKLVSLHEWNFLFLIGAFFALIALRLLSRVREVGEVEKDIVKRIMRTSIKNNLKESFLIGNLMSWHEQFLAILKRGAKKL